VLVTLKNTKQMIGFIDRCWLEIEMDDSYSHDKRPHKHRTQRDAGYHRERTSNKDECQSLHPVSDKENKREMKDQFEMRNFKSSSNEAAAVTLSSRRGYDRDDANTAVTGATSDFAYSIQDSEDEESFASLRCARFGGPVAAGAVGLLAFLSPVAMVLLPKIDIMAWHIKPCETSCQIVLISLVWRLLLLLIASCLLFLRSPHSTMPRIFVFRALIIFLIFILMFTYWLFYLVRVYSTFGRSVEQEVTYEQVATFTLSFAEVLIFVHYLAVVLIELRQLDVLYTVKIIRSPDGMSQSYSVGRLSIQRLAVWCLEQYYKDFEVCLTLFLIFYTSSSNCIN
jgi:vang-like